MWAGTFVAAQAAQQLANVSVERVPLRHRLRSEKQRRMCVARWLRSATQWAATPKTLKPWFASSRTWLRARSLFPAVRAPMSSEPCRSWMSTCLRAGTPLSAKCSVTQQQTKPTSVVPAFVLLQNSKVHAALLKRPSTTATSAWATSALSTAKSIVCASS